MLLSTVTPAGGTTGALSSMSYLGFGVGQTGGRRIVQKVFTDPVALAGVGTAAGRTGTVFLDKLGRDHAPRWRWARTMRTRPSSPAIAPMTSSGAWGSKPTRICRPRACGTAYDQFFNTDGTPSCFIRGHGPGVQAVTDEASERYPTCFSRFFANNQGGRACAGCRVVARRFSAGGGGAQSHYSAIGRLLTFDV